MGDEVSCMTLLSLYISLLVDQIIKCRIQKRGYKNIKSWVFFLRHGWHLSKPKEMRSLAWQKPNWPRPNCCNLTTDQPIFVRILLSSLCQVLLGFASLLIWNLFIHWQEGGRLSDFFLFCWCDIWHLSCVMVDLIIMLRKLARLRDHWGKIRKDKARPSD